MAVDTAVSPVRASRSNQFPYEVFMEGEGVPVHNAVVGVDDVTKLPREPWARTGGKGTFIELVGTFESERGIYVAEIPGGGALEPEQPVSLRSLHGGRGGAGPQRRCGGRRCNQAAA